MSLESKNEQLPAATVVREGTARRLGNPTGSGALTKTLAALATIASFAVAPAHSQVCPLGNSPEGLAFDTEGNLWAAYYDTNTIFVFSPSDYNTVAIDATGDAMFNSQYGGINGPTRIATAPSTDIYDGPYVFVTNSAGNSISVLTRSGLYEGQIQGLQRPLGVAVNGSLDLFVANNQTSNIGAWFAPSIIGDPPQNAGYTSLGVKTTDYNGHLFSAPGALAINGQNLYVATNDGTVHAYNEAEFLLSYEWIFPEGMAEIATYADGSSGGPTGIAFDNEGNVYVSYYYSSDVVKYSPSGTKLMPPITAAVSQPEGIAVEPSTGYVYVANTGTHNITMYNSEGVYLGVFQPSCPTGGPFE